MFETYMIWGVAQNTKEIGYVQHAWKFTSSLEVFLDVSDYKAWSKTNVMDEDF